ncbi:MAG: putative 2-aminoethylphosphonate ABC transporter ATP-binding protein [Reyranellaceae bacterium]
MATGSGAAYLEVRDLEKRFGEFVALRDISLSIEKGEFVVFLGPSGCGKTTLLRAIAGLDRHSAGSIVQDGREISNLAPAQRDFGIVFQSYALFPNLTVESNIAYGLRRMDGAQKRKRVAELLQLIGLPGSGDKYPSQLSGGQQQRVALARAIAPSPGLLLLDEPLSALDARVRIHLRKEIRDLQRRLDVTTIMVTHDQEEALTMADRIVVMNHGVIEQIGTPEEIYRLPASVFVANFIGAMNFVAGRAVDDGIVRCGGVDLASDAPHRRPAGSQVTVAIRPEDIAVRNLPPGGSNIVEARIVDLEFLGAFCRATLATGLGEAADLKADFSINAVRDLGLKPGHSLPVRLPPDRLVVYSAE